MFSTRNQRTIASAAVVTGFGYWTGRDVQVEFRPAEPDTGIVFVRRDLDGCPRIPASAVHRTNTPLRTSLNVGVANVEMVEHIMAALAGLQVDNCEIWVDQEEMPGCDGSSLPFVEAINNAGTTIQPAVRRQFVVPRVIRMGTDECWVEARPCCSGKTILQYELDYGVGNPIGRQTLEVALSPKFFHKSLAPSRTFLLEHEADALRAQGMGLRVTCQDLLVFGPQGPIDNSLRFPDECVRHKMLDMVGDLALAGCDLVGRFTAYRSGHRLNAALIRTLLADAENERSLKRCA